MGLLKTPAGSPEISGVTSSPQFVSSNDTVPIEEPTPLASIVLTVARAVSAHAAEAMASTNADASSSRGSIQPITVNRAFTASGLRRPTDRAFTAAGKRRVREQSKGVKPDSDNILGRHQSRQPSKLAAS